ncbi:hypothetical protein HYH02_001999 [Chlamydomonas schloesseri]|uniref:Tbc2 translation factor, chloroplastic n=1 Tax=Chlamydomonas schloesseri TaxID=2026947 RepID=A0A835WU64_9CHLO|nr:hypothetical protein HYH02_001999 [Chlamydomonas schloesseri]|eukprot:KAG2453790.1 hypothetical protein HYH02_001999 [Chlamydomonas schloesseri]
MAQLHASSSGGSGRGDGLVRRRLELSRPPMGRQMGGRGGNSSTKAASSASEAAEAAETAARFAASQQPGALPPLRQPLAAADYHQQQSQQPQHSLLPHGRGVAGAAAAASGVYESREAFLRRLERAVLAHLPDFGARQLANTLWAVAKLGYRPSRQWLDAVLTAARGQLLKQLRTGDGAVAAAGGSSGAGGSGAQQGAGFEPQHLANMLYALATLGFTPKGDWLSLFFAAVERHLHGFGPAELAHLCYAGGRLRLQPGRRLLGGFIHHSGLHMDRYGVREQALLLYGLVHMGATIDNYDWMRSFRIRTMELVIRSGALPTSRLEQLVPRLNLPLAAAVAEQLAAAREDEAGSSGGMDVDRQGRRSGRRHGRRRGGGEAARAAQAAMVVQYLPSLLLSMGTAGYHPPPVFLEVVLGVLGSGYSSSRSASSSTAWQGASPRSLGPVGLSSLLLALAYMRYRPHPRWFAGVWQAVMSSLDAFDPQQTSNVLWAAAQLQQGPGADPRLLPRRDVSRLLCAVASRLPEHTDSEVLAALQAAALVRGQRRLFEHQPYQRQEQAEQGLLQERAQGGMASSLVPGPAQQAGREAAAASMSAAAAFPRRDWLELMETELYGRLHQLKPAELGAALQHWAALGHRPNRLWMARWAEAAAPAVTAAAEDAVEVVNGGPLRAGGLSFEQLCRMAHAAARLGFRPPAPLRSALLQATSTYLSAVVAADAAAAPQASEGAEPQPSRLDRMVGAGAVSWLLWSLALLEVRPSDEWMASYMGAMAAVMRREQQQQQQQQWGPVAAAAEALRQADEREAAVGLGGGGMEAMGLGAGAAAWGADVARGEGFSARQLSLVVWALARLRYDPGPEWMQLFVERSQPLVVTPAPATTHAAAAAAPAAVPTAGGRAAAAPAVAVAAAAAVLREAEAVSATAVAAVSLAEAAHADAHAAGDLVDVAAVTPMAVASTADAVELLAAATGGAAHAEPERAVHAAPLSQDHPSTSSAANTASTASSGSRNSTSGTSSSSSSSRTGTGKAATVGNGGVGGLKPVLDFSRVILQGLTAWAVTQISGGKQTPGAAKGSGQAGNELEAAAAAGKKRGGLSRKRI